MSDERGGYGDVLLPRSSLQPGGAKRATEDFVIHVEPFRSVALGLPFALRFRLKLCLFEDDVVKIRQGCPHKRGNAEEPDARREEIAAGAQRLAFALVRHAVPTLLELN